DGGGDGPSFADLWKKYIKKRQTPRFIRSLSAVWSPLRRAFFVALSLFVQGKFPLAALSMRLPINGGRISWYNTYKTTRSCIERKLK
ncbi:MAG: hypothetical protein KH322_07035, partial [Peptoniphilaceae bacterium]|nr:hypothetical protein [Peptoniphilaceae bacterium]